MNKGNSILRRFRDVNLPNGNDYDVSTLEGKRRYTDAWSELAKASDVIVKAIVHYLVQPMKSSETRFMRKLLKHSERCRVLGERTYANWMRTADWVENSKLNVGEILWTFLGEKTQKEKWSVLEERAISTETQKCAKLYNAVSRERELLLIELDAVRKGENGC